MCLSAAHTRGSWGGLNERADLLHTDFLPAPKRRPEKRCPIADTPAVSPISTAVTASGCACLLFLFQIKKNFFFFGPMACGIWGFPGGTVCKETACNVGDLGSVPGWGRSPGERKGYPLQYSDLDYSMDCIVHGIAESDMTE